MRRQIRITIFLLLLLLSASSSLIAAQGNVAQWLRYDVNINIQQNSGVTVEEIHEVSLVSGATTFERIIPTARVEDISNITVLEINPTSGQRSYQPANSQADYTFETIVENNQHIIRLHFPPNDVSSTRFIVKYFLAGSLSFYEEGDRFTWQPFGDSTPAPIQSSNIVIRLPGQFSDTEVTRKSTGFDQVNSFFNDGNRVSFTTSNMPAGRDLEISVTFPHGVVQGSQPQWQTIEDWRPILQWGSVTLGIILSFVSLLAVFGWWYFKVRVSPSDSGKLPKYIGSPPGKLSPGIVGTLLDGKTSPKHLLGDLLDLAYRGAINVEPAQGASSNDPDDEPAKPTFNIYATDHSKTGPSHEAYLYSRLFGQTDGQRRSLADIQQSIFTAIPELKNQIDFEIIKAGYISDEGTVSRRQYLSFGGAGILISIVLMLLAAVVAGSRFTYLVMCPFAGLGLGAVALMLVGFVVPKQTEKGANEAARWQAFKRYLKDMGRKDAAKVKSKFARFLPYAIAFGIEEEVIEKFGAANTSAPNWWGKPEEKGPNLDYAHAHRWVGSSATEETSPERKKPKDSGTKSRIRRLGESAGDTSQRGLLKQIKPSLLAFLEAGHELFSQSPTAGDEEESNFEALQNQ